MFIFNVGLVSVGIAIALNQYYGPSLYPGVAVWLSTLLATLGCFSGGHLLRLVDYLPRSGGVYVSLSRRGEPGDRLRLVVDEDRILTYYAALRRPLLHRDRRALVLR